jgi:hypothetical protein
LKETWFEVEVNRIAGEIALCDRRRGAGNLFRAGAGGRAGAAGKFWEVCAATSMARLWRDQGKLQQAHDFLASIYGWFTEGFDTRNLKEVKALLVSLSAR